METTEEWRAEQAKNAILPIDPRKSHEKQKKIKGPTQDQLHVFVKPRNADGNLMPFATYAGQLRFARHIHRVLQIRGIFKVVALVCAEDARDVEEVYKAESIKGLIASSIQDLDYSTVDVKTIYRNCTNKVATEHLCILLQNLQAEKAVFEPLFTVRCPLPNALTIATDRTVDYAYFAQYRSTSDSKYDAEERELASKPSLKYVKFTAMQKGDYAGMGFAFKNFEDDEVEEEERPEEDQEKDGGDGVDGAGDVHGDNAAGDVDGGEDDAGDYEEEEEEEEEEDDD